MNRFGKILLSSLFILFIFIVGLYKFTTQDNAISEVENRQLAQKPTLTTENFTSGTFMKNFESYFTDQFPGRNTWLKAYTDYQLLANKTYINNFYISNDHYIIPKPGYSFKTKEYEIAANKVNAFGEYLQNQGMEFYYFSLPHKATILQFLYPSYIKEGEQRRRSEYFLSKLDEDTVIKVDINKLWVDKFSQEELKQMYFQTDHHWNIQGAFEAYKTIATTFATHSDYYRGNKDELSRDTYTKECIPSEKPFVGTYNRQLYSTVENQDNENMCTYLNQDVFTNFKVELNGKPIDPFDVYASGLKEYGEKDHIVYSNIFSDDERNITIINENNKAAGNILILKDSYTNPLIYLIAQNFYKTTIYDIRYNQDRTVTEFLKGKDYDAVAILYNNTQVYGDVFDMGTGSLSH